MSIDPNAPTAADWLRLAVRSRRAEPAPWDADWGVWAKQQAWLDEQLYEALEAEERK